MEEESHSISIFEKYYVSKYPDCPFIWIQPPEDFKLNPAEIVCEGELKEINGSTGAIHAPQYFLATKEYLIRCIVFLESGNKFRALKIKLHAHYCIFAIRD